MLQPDELSILGLFLSTGAASLVGFFVMLFGGLILCGLSIASRGLKRDYCIRAVMVWGSVSLG